MRELERLTADDKQSTFEELYEKNSSKNSDKESYYGENEAVMEEEEE